MGHVRITIIAFGTRGDVQPVLALGKALKAGGHQVRMVASANFRPWIEGHGLEAATANVDIQAMMQSEGGHEWVEHGTNQIKQMRVMKKLLDQYGLAMMHEPGVPATAPK
jgi:UDP:flavonoid glycosyltransferase YjiC (YdhE family)